MKIRSVLLLAIFAFTSLTAFAKEDSTKLKSGTNKHILNEDTQIKPFDFQKLFSEAETYFKASKAWTKLKCEPKSGFICTKRECPKRDIKAYLILDKKAQTITRCEKEVCESFPAEFKQTGVFFNIQTEGPVGTLIRILGDSRYKEITTVGLDAYIANGNCEVVTSDE